MAGVDVRHPELAAGLSRLASALVERETSGIQSPTYLEMAVLSEKISGELLDLARMLVAAARVCERATWAEVGSAFGVTRQAAMRRWSDHE